MNKKTEIKLPAYKAGIPMTYLANGKQYVVVGVDKVPAQLAALALPQ
jgi:hypothetical protein